MTKNNKYSKIFSIFLIIIGTLISLRLIYKFYTFHFIIPLPYKSLPGIYVDAGMSNTALLYSILGLAIGIVLIKKVFQNNKNIIKLGLIGLFVGLGINLLFYITNPWYTLQMYPRLFMYQDGKNITNKEIYFYLTEKYGFDPTLYKPFKTIDDSISGLEFAKKIGNKSLYSGIFYDLDKFGYEEVFKKYNDITFQAYFLKAFVNDPFVDDKPLFDSNINKIGDFKKYISNIQILEAISHIEKKRDEFKGKELNTDFYLSLSDEVILILKKLINQGVNDKILPL